MKLQNQLRDIMIAAGYAFTDTNRSYFCKAVNKCLSGGLVTLKITEKGMVTRKASGILYNVSVSSISGWTSTRHIKGGYITSSEVLRVIGQHLQIPQVKEKNLRVCRLARALRQVRRRGLYTGLSLLLRRDMF